MAQDSGTSNRAGAAQTANGDDGRAAIRNVALVGPNGTGKTTLLESLLFVTGAVSRKGRVADRNSVGDASAEARERQMSTEVSIASFVHEGIRFNLLDCPGSIEFQQEMRGEFSSRTEETLLTHGVLRQLVRRQDG